MSSKFNLDELKMVDLLIEQIQLETTKLKKKSDFLQIILPKCAIDKF